MEVFEFLVIEIIFMHTLVFAFCTVIPIDSANDRRPVVPHIVGGSPVDIEKIPWQVSLHSHSRHHCGGSIISPKWILTAAHCISGKNVNNLSVRIGSTKYGSGGRSINVIRIVNHPKYSSRANDYDFGLVQLLETLNFTKKMQPIALPNANDEIADGTLCATSGWGVTQNPNESTDILRKVNVPIVNQEKCMEFYPAEKITPSMICAGFESGGKDSCQGDSGGPLMDSIPRLIGIVSWGYGCAAPYKPGVYARVTFARQWIKSVAGI